MKNVGLPVQRMKKETLNWTNTRSGVEAFNNLPITLGTEDNNSELTDALLAQDGVDDTTLMMNFSVIVFSRYPDPEMSIGG